MYEDFVAKDRWTGEPQHCVWKGTVVAIATRHADATDIRFAVNGRPLWIAMPNDAWVEQKRRNGKVITDYLAAQAAGLYLKQSIENGYDNGREFYTMTVAEVLENVAAVVKERSWTSSCRGSRIRWLERWASGRAIVRRVVSGWTASE
jgi:hypothetical protein